MPSLVTWAAAVQYMGGDEARLTRYFQGDTSGAHPIFDANLAIADGMMRSKIGERYSTASYDALTTSTAPDYMKFHQFSLALGAVTAHDDARPESVNKYAGIAAGWLEDIVGSKARIIELETVAPSQLPTAKGVSSAAETRRFSRSNTTGAYNTIDEPLFRGEF